MAKRIEKYPPPAAPTRGPWRWFGNTRNDDIYLAAPWGGRHLVMSFRRWGMGSAQPCFYADGLRRDIGVLVKYERHYRDDISEIDHPDARLIAAAPELLDVVKSVAMLSKLLIDPEVFPFEVIDKARTLVEAIIPTPLKSATSVDAVDPSGGSEGTPTTREKDSDAPTE